jgi:beta-glucosidase
VGPLADSQNNMLGTWAPTGEHHLAVKVIDGVKNVVGDEVEILYAKGANIVDDPDYAEKINVFGPKVEIDERSPEEMIREALAVSARADVIVAVVGEASEMSGESGSRSDITVPENQKKLIRALAETGKPLVLVTMSGRPLALEEENKLADALLQTWHPGVEAGNAIAGVLFGETVPSGKLTATFPRNVGQVPIYYAHRFTGRPQESDEFQKFKTNYLDVPNSPLFPFGYGLSYTQFEYSNLKISSTEMTMDGELEVSVDVQNTGDYDGAEIVQLYIRDVVASVTPPVRELKGFEKVFIPKGETETVTFTITAEDLAFYNNDLEFKTEPGEFIVFVGGNSNAEKSVEFTLVE